MVVPVLMTSCQVSEKLKKGPVSAQARTIQKAHKKAVVLPAALLTQLANRSKSPGFFLCVDLFMDLHLVLMNKFITRMIMQEPSFLFLFPKNGAGQWL